MAVLRSLNEVNKLNGYIEGLVCLELDAVSH